MKISIEKSVVILVFNNFTFRIGDHIVWPLFGALIIRFSVNIGTMIDQQLCHFYREKKNEFNQQILLYTWRTKLIVKLRIQSSSVQCSCPRSVKLNCAIKCNGVIFHSSSTALTFDPLLINISAAFLCPVLCCVVLNLKLNY